MSKTHAHADEVLNVLKGSNVTGFTPYIALLTAASDLEDPSTWTEAAYSGYARQQMDFGSITTVNGARQMTGPTSDKLFPAVAGSQQTIVAWCICNHATNAVSTAAKRSVDSAFSKTYAVGEQPKVAANSITVSED